MKNLLFVLAILLFFSCSKDDEVVAPPEDTPEFRSFITAKVDGDDYIATIPYNLVGSEFEQTISYQEITDNNSECININYTAELKHLEDSTLPKLSIGFVGFLSQNNIMCSEEVSNFEALFELQQYDYANNTGDYGANILYVTNTNNILTYYTTYLSDQTNSNFEITDVVIENCEPKSCIRVSGSFNCTLFNTIDNTDTIEITEGTFKLKLLSFN